MKQFFNLIVILFVAFNSLSQEDSARVSIVNWAGGVCCSSGERFSVHFKVAQPGYKVDSMELNIDGMGYKVRCLQSMEIRPNEYVFRFDITNSNNEVPNGLNVYYEGIEEMDVFPLTVNYELLRIYFHNGKTQNTPINVERQMLAYP
ncbi:MAG: hypothetical protein RI922_1041 [Bacteroidota bacterium]|jgi:hypothetical protein